MITSSLILQRIAHSPPVYIAFSCRYLEIQTLQVDLPKEIKRYTIMARNSLLSQTHTPTRRHRTVIATHLLLLLLLLAPSAKRLFANGILCSMSRRFIYSFTYTLHIFWHNEALQTWLSI